MGCGVWGVGTGDLGTWGLGAGRRLHNKTDLFWLQYLDILSLLPGGIGEK